MPPGRLCQGHGHHVPGLSVSPILVSTMSQDALRRSPQMHTDSEDELVLLCPMVKVTQ